MLSTGGATNRVRKDTCGIDEGFRLDCERFVTPVVPHSCATNLPIRITQEIGYPGVVQSIFRLRK